MKKMAKSPGLGLVLAAIIFQGVLGVHVTVNHRELIVKEGDPVEFLCHANSMVEVCRVSAPGEGSFIVTPTKRLNGMSYLGDGFERGDCGIKVFAAKESHNGEFYCAITVSESQKEIFMYMNLTIAKTPNRPEIRVTPAQEGDSYKEGELLSASCTVKNGRPAANISWYIGEERLYEGLGQPVVIGFKDLYNIEQNLTRRIQATDNGKPLRCVAEHPLLAEKQNTSLKIIYVKFPPKEFQQPLERFGLVEGEEGRISISVPANPQPSFTWTIGEERLHESDQDGSGRIHALPATPTPNMGQGSWDAVLIINPLTKEDTDRNYVLTARNALGEQTYKIIISTSPEPQMLELGAGAIVGIVIAVLLVLTVAALLLFARAKGRWCFSGPSGHLAGESSDTESADVHHPKVKKTPFTSVFKKKTDKVSTEGTAQPNIGSADQDGDKERDEEGEEEDDGDGEEAARVVLNPDEGVVYAELDLNLQRPAQSLPTVRAADDKTEYAEIIHAKESS